MIDADSPEFVASFARGISVIRAFGPGATRLTLSDVAETTGLTRAAARRFLLTLVALGYARSDGKYFELTPAVLEIGYAYLASLDIWESVQPYLRGVTEQLHESCSAAVLEGDEVVYVARSAVNRRVLSINLAVGTRLPAHATAMGQVLLAGLEPAALTRYLKAATLAAYTEKTTTDPAALRARLDGIRAQGYALADQELESGLRSLAVPLHNRDGRVIAAINVSAPAAQVPAEVMIATYLPVLRDAASRCDQVSRLR